jgi:type II secretory pathway pseudopilin PulG
MGIIGVVIAVVCISIALALAQDLWSTHRQKRRIR